MTCSGGTTVVLVSPTKQSKNEHPFDIFCFQVVFSFYLWYHALNITPGTLCEFFREI